jgi:hypothetical protein
MAVTGLGFQQNPLGSTPPHHSGFFLYQGKKFAPFGGLVAVTICSSQSTQFFPNQQQPGHSVFYDVAE